MSQQDLDDLYVIVMQNSPRMTPNEFDDYRGYKLSFYLVSPAGLFLPIQ